MPKCLLQIWVDTLITFWTYLSNESILNVKLGHYVLVSCIPAQSKDSYFIGCQAGQLVTPSMNLSSTGVSMIKL